MVKNKHCRNCKTEVSENTNRCQACGAFLPSLKLNEILLGSLGLIFIAYLTIKFTSKDEIQEEKVLCKIGDISCLINQSIGYAKFQCDYLLDEYAQKAAKYQYRPAENKDYQRFPDVGLFSEAEKTLILKGNDAYFQNGFGAWKKTPYSCFFKMNNNNPEMGEVIKLTFDF